MDLPVAVNWRERITADPAVMVGQPVIRGMRITLALVLECLAAGWTVAEVLGEYPDLEQKDIQACHAYALELVRDWRLISLPAA